MQSSLLFPLFLRRSLPLSRPFLHSFDLLFLIVVQLLIMFNQSFANITRLCFTFFNVALASFLISVLNAFHTISIASFQFTLCLESIDVFKKIRLLCSIRSIRAANCFKAKTFNDKLSLSFVIITLFHRSINILTITLVDSFLSTCRMWKMFPFHSNRATWTSQFDWLIDFFISIFNVK